MPLQEEQVKNAVLVALGKMNYRLVQGRALREHGCDIVAKHINYGRYFYIEAKGDSGRTAKSPGSGREVRFISAVGQIITRIRPERGYRYGLAFPATYRKIVTSRLHYSVLKLLHIELFFVDQQLKVEHLTWKDLKEEIGADAPTNTSIN